ncbi:hypothetical protein FOZ60_013674 [Perkinsus olseni]|uniref:Uncharacterized protein n=1 Tax=Perkinsus olseni TaxID=32597 RepID=A0A7J6N8X1_PEROL|nr:hypothetical protein FOZ60_013674 [Perkinsus olseni]
MSTPCSGHAPESGTCGLPNRSVHECHYDVWDLDKSQKTCCPDEMAAWVELKRKEHFVEVTVIITIAILTIIFDAAKESLIKLAEKRSNHILVKIINSVNSEFATLGFIALLFGVVENRLQALGPMNDHIFGDHLWVMYGPHEYAAWVAENLHGHRGHHGPHCLSHLSLIFETMHFSIFYLMIGFIFVCAAFTLSVLNHARTWDRAQKSDFSTLVKEFFSTSPKSLFRSDLHSDASLVKNARHQGDLTDVRVALDVAVVGGVDKKESLESGGLSETNSRKDPRMGPTSIEHLHTKAPYSSEGNHFKPNGWLISFLRGTTVPTMHENVFLLQKNGPAFIAKALQVVCFATALYSGCLFFRLLDFTTKRWRRYWFLLPAGAFPILIIIFDILPSALERLVISTSVCQMKRMHVIMEVKKMLEAHRCELCLNLLRNVKLLSMHYLLTEAPEAQRDHLRQKLEAIYEKVSPHTKSLYMKTWKRFFANESVAHRGEDIRASLAAAGIVGQAASVFLSWLETLATSHSGELELREFCVIMIALRVAVNNVISEDEFCAAIRRALPLRDTAGADEVPLSPEDVRNILEEFKVVHPRSHVIARHMTNFTSANQLLEVEERSGHDVHSPLTEALMLVTAIENANIYVRKDELPKRGNLQVSLLEFVRYFIKLDIYQTHDSQNSSPEPFDHMASLEFKSERPWMPL